MAMHVRQSGQKYQTRQAAATTTSLSVPTVIEIGVCGGVGLLGILLVVTYFVVRKKHKKAKRKESSEELDEVQEIRDALRSTRPPDLDLGNRRSYLQFFGNKKKVVSNPWADEDGLHGPQIVHSKSFTPGSESGGSQKGYPLIPLTQPPALPKFQSNIPHEPFSPSDFYPVISPPGKLAIPQQAHTQVRSYDIYPSRSTIRCVPYEHQKLPSKRRSVSENQLTSILRQTSQRIKRERRASQRPLSRAHSVLSQISGGPPTQRLPTPPRNNFGENGYGDSREGLIDTRDKSRPGSEKSFDTFNYETILNSFPSRRTPSPSKEVPWSADHVTGKRFSSNSAATDEDSLCNGRTPDVVIPCHLTSPSKRRANNVRVFNGGEHHPVNIHSEKDSGAKSAVEISTRIRKDSRASIQALGYFDLQTQQRRLLVRANDPENGNDPFFSSPVKSERPTTKVNQILIGPRSPIVKSYSPKRGHSRRASSISRPMTSKNLLAGTGDAKLPLRDISGNSNQGSPSKFNDELGGSKLGLQLASFQWSPAELGHSHARRTSVSSISPGITKRQHQGHKRQNVVRISGLPRPRSVCPVPEESEDLNDCSFLTSKLDLSQVPSAPPPLFRLQSSESLARSVSLASIYSRYSTMDNVQPPSSSVFEPRLNPLPLNGNSIRPSISLASMGSSPTLGSHHRAGYGTALSSPSRNAPNIQKCGLPETDDDFSESSSNARTFSKRKVKRMGRNFSIDSGIVYAKGSPFAFPPPPTPGVSSRGSGDPFSNANNFSFPFPGSYAAATPPAYSEPAPPILTRLHSPSSPQRIANSSDFLLKNITQLRRGNSTLSSYSIRSMGSTLTIGLGERDDTNPSLADFRGGGTSPSKKGDEYTGSKHYLNLSNPNSGSSSPTRKGKRNFPLSPRSNTTSPFKSVTFGDLNKGLGLGIGLPASESQHSYAENRLKVFETIEQEPDTLSPTPPRNFKRIRKGSKSLVKQENAESISNPNSSPPSVPNPDKGAWAENPKEKSFEFENYSLQHFENLVGFSFSEDDEDGYGEDDEDMVGQGGRIDDSTDPSKENVAPSEPFQFQGLPNLLRDQHKISGATSIPGPNLKKSSSDRNGLESGWEIYRQPQSTISPMQLSYSRLGVSNPSANQSTVHLHTSHNTNSALSPQPSKHQKTKSIEILSPSPTSSSLSQILQKNHHQGGNEILQLHYPKTSRWVWEETTPKVSPSPSPDRKVESPGKRYKAHSRNQSRSAVNGGGRYAEGGMQGERRMGNPLSSNPTVSTLMMERELGMKEPRIIDLDEANPSMPLTHRSSNPDPTTGDTNESQLAGVGDSRTHGEEQDTTSTLPINTQPPPSSPSSNTEKEETGAKNKKKSKLPKTKTKVNHLENIFSRHHREKGDGVVDANLKRGSLYDQDGFLKSSPGPAPDAGRSSRGWGVRGKR